MMAEYQRLHTTGRLSSRMTAADKAKLQARLTPFSLQPPEIAAWPATELEIGMGNGMALLERARQQPEKLFIGNEIYLNGLRRLVGALEATDAPLNIRIAPQDVRDVLASLPANSLHRILIPYPDPWHKARHHKRRLIQPAVLESLHTVLQPTGELWVMSDIPDYIDWTLAQVATHGRFACHTHSTTPPPWWVSTKYEQKALRAGRTPTYLMFTRQ